MFSFFFTFVTLILPILTVKVCAVTMFLISFKDIHLMRAQDKRFVIKYISGKQQVQKE